MKKLLIFIGLVICINSQSQNLRRPLAIIGYNIGTVALGAFASSMHNDNPPVSYALHILEAGFVIAGPLFFDVKKDKLFNYILSYGFIRMSLFNGFYNAYEGNPMFYNGNRNVFDSAMSRVPDYQKALLKGSSFIIGFVIPIKSFSN